MIDPERITLNHGPLRFSALSAGSGPLVLCLHGFPDNANSWRQQLPALAAAGFHAVAVTLRGYEPASQPIDGDYSLPTLAGDVLAFIEELGERRTHLVGHDWGAAIACAAGAMAPERFRSLTLMSVPHNGRFVNEAIRYPKQLRLSWYMLFFQLRGVAEFASSRNDFRFIRRLWLQWSPGWKPDGTVLDDVVATLREPGVLTAALSYYRAALAPRAFTPSARAANRFQVRVPTLAITGRKDRCIDSEVFLRLTREADFPVGLEVRQLENAGHFPHQECPDMFNAILLQWLQQREDQGRP